MERVKHETQNDLTCVVLNVSQHPIWDDKTAILLMLRPDVICESRQGIHHLGVGSQQVGNTLYLGRAHDASHFGTIFDAVRENNAPDESQHPEALPLFKNEANVSRAHLNRKRVDDAKIKVSPF